MGLGSIISGAVGSLFGGGSSVVGTALGVAGLGLNIYSTIAGADAAEEAAQNQAAAVNQAAAANAAISRYDAAVATQDANEIIFQTKVEVGNFRRQVDKLIGAQRARFAKSGVATNVGTPLEVARETLAAADRDVNMLKYSGMRKAERQLSLADRYRLLADSGLRDAAATASSLIESGQDRSDMLLISGFSNAARNLYSVGDNAGWWS